MSVSSQNGVIPFMLSPLGQGAGISAVGGPAAVGTGFYAGTATQITASLGIVNGFGGSATGVTKNQLGQCRIYAAMYDMSPMYTSRYLSEMPVKQILYNDILYFQSTNVLPGSVMNQILTNGVSRPRYLLGIPMLASAYNRAAVARVEAGNGLAAILAVAEDIGCGYSPMNSPFSSAPGTTCPQARLTNFNVLMSGSNLYQNAYSMCHESFLQELRQCNCINGGLELGLSSGLLSQSDFENGYSFIFANLERKDSQANDDIARSVQVMFTNASNVALDVFWIISYERSISISTSTGTLVI